MELRDLLLRNFDCQVTVKSSTGNANTWSEAFISFVRANGLLQIKIEQQTKNESKLFSLTKNIKACYSWTNTAANRVTLKTLNPNATLTIDFHSKEDESNVGKFLKRIQYNQEDAQVEPDQMQPNKHIENHKKRKPVTYASKPPVQKKIATAFTPLNNFDEDVDRQSLRKQPTRASNDRKVFQNLENRSPVISPVSSPVKKPIRSPSKSSVQSPIKSHIKSPTKNDSGMQSPRRSNGIVTSPPRTPTRLSLPSSQGSENSSPIRSLFKARSPAGSPRSSAGLSNLGNTCYLNSILQSIINLESFRHSLLNVKINDIDKVEGTLFQSLTKVLRHRISNPNEMIDHDTLRDCISRTSERFTKYQQEDSHEYLSICLNKLHQEALQICDDYSDNCSEPNVQKCPVDDNFQCRVQSTLSCTQCSWSSTHYEIFRDLSLNLPDSSVWQCNDSIGVDVSTLLYQYFKDEKVSYKCEKCQCTVATVQTKIDRAPQVLVLHLKRFTKDMYDDVCQKRTDNIQLRTRLNLGRWCADNVIIPENSCSKTIDSIQDSADILSVPSPTAISDSNDNKENGLRPLAELQQLAEIEAQQSGGLNVEYQLKSVVSHLGSTIKRGHFVCDAQKEEEGWVCYNDSSPPSAISNNMLRRSLVAASKLRVRPAVYSLSQKAYYSAAAQPQEKIKLTPSLETVFSPEFKFIQNAEPIPAYRVMDQSGHVLDSAQEPNVSKEFAVNIYQNMLTLNIMDNILYEAQRQGRISFYMTHYGEEAFMGSAAALTTDDVVFGQYREATVLMYRGFTIDEFMNQCYSNDLDYGKGRQMPVHYGSKRLNFQTISSPLGTQIPQATGAGYALKLANRKACAVCFFGEGAASEGDFHAGLNMAATLKSPTIFICRNNGYAISTPSVEQFKGDGIASRGVGYGMDTIRVDGNDVWAVYNATLEARKIAVEHNRPVLIEAMTYRVGHHSTSDDSSKYRDRLEVERRAEMDNPITRLRKWLEVKNWWNKEDEDNYRKEARKLIMKSFLAAEKRKKPSISELFTDVYDELTPNLIEQQKELHELMEKYPEHYSTDNYAPKSK